MSFVQIGLAATGNLLQAFLFAFVGYAMAMKLRSKARVPGAARAFVVWWYLMAFQGLLVAVMDVGAAAGWLSDLRGYQVLYGLNILVASAQIWALGYYLIYLWTGKDRAPQIWLALFAIAYFVYFFVLVLVARPVSVSIGTWSTGLNLGLSPTQVAVIGVLFFLPIFALLGGYFILAFEVKGESQRLRVIVLGVVAALWNVSLVDRFATDATEPAPFLGFIMVLNLAWLIVLYVVYFPPAWLRRQLAARSAAVRVEEVAEEGPEHPDAPHREAEHGEEPVAGPRPAEADDGPGSVGADGSIEGGSTHEQQTL